MTRYLLYRDGVDAYFMRVGLGTFWECGPRQFAKEFTRRADAAKILHRYQKHLAGWRIVTERATNAEPK